MDSFTRQELKKDKFVEEVTHAATYVGAHKSQVTMYVVAGVVVILLAVGGWYFMQNRKHARQSALAEAMKTYNSVVGPQATPQLKSFPTEADRQKAIVADLTPVATKYAGTDEGAVASYLLGVNAVDQGNIADAEKNLKAAVAEGGDYSSLAKLSLADVYAAQGKPDEAEKLLRDLMTKPTVLVSKEQASLSLAHLLAKSKPDEARKILEAMRSQTGSASRAAVTMLGELSQAK